MYSKFLEGLTGKVAEQWAATVLTPAFVFWLGGFVACVDYLGWERIKAWVLQYSSFQVGLLILCLLVIVTSAAIVQMGDRAMLRFLEGYWPAWMEPLRRVRTQRSIKKWERNMQRWQELYGKYENSLTAEELNEFAQLDWLIVHSPSSPQQFMPTRIGNLLRASEYRSRDRYGLDAIVCWPRLWLLLPDSSRNELQVARAALDAAVRICLWSLLFLVWTPLAWWAPLVAFPAAWLGYRMALNTTSVYVDLLEATFDVHRHLLYDSMRLRKPQNPVTETEEGTTLTKYLWRGPDPSMSDFYDPPAQ